MFKSCEAFNPWILEPLLKYCRHICITLHRKRMYSFSGLWALGGWFRKTQYFTFQHKKYSDSKMKNLLQGLGICQADISKVLVLLFSHFYLLLKKKSVFIAAVALHFIKHLCFFLYLKTVAQDKLKKSLYQKFLISMLKVPVRCELKCK